MNERQRLDALDCLRSLADATQLVSRHQTTWLASRAQKTFLTFIFSNLCSWQQNYQLPILSWDRWTLPVRKVCCNGRLRAVGLVCYFWSFTIPVSPLCVASWPENRKDTLRRQYVPRAEASASSTPPTGPQQVTLEISDRLHSHMLYKYSMCSKDNLACAASRENEGCQAQKAVATVVVWTPASGNLPA